MSRNYFNYFTEIEEYFVRKRGRNLLVSPLDWCLIELWKENGVPLHVVLRGIDRSFESASRHARKSPRTLHYCHPAVMEAFDEYQEARVGSHGEEEEPAAEPEVPRERLVEFLDSLCRRLAEHDSGVSDRAVKRLEAVKAEIRAAHVVKLETVDGELGEIRRALISELSQTLSSERLAELRKEARRETRSYKKRLASEMYERLLEKHLEAKLAELFELPEFSLIHLE